MKNKLFVFLLLITGILLSMNSSFANPPNTLTDPKIPEGGSQQFTAIQRLYSTLNSFRISSYSEADLVLCEMFFEEYLKSKNIQYTETGDLGNKTFTLKMNHEKPQTVRFYLSERMLKFRVGENENYYIANPSKLIQNNKLYGVNKKSTGNIVVELTYKNNIGFESKELLKEQAPKVDIQENTLPGKKEVVTPLSGTLHFVKQQIAWSKEDLNIGQLRAFILRNNVIFDTEENSLNSKDSIRIKLSSGNVQTITLKIAPNNVRVLTVQEMNTEGTLITKKYELTKPGSTWVERRRIPAKVADTTNVVYLVVNDVNGLHAKTEKDFEMKKPEPAKVIEDPLMQDPHIKKLVDEINNPKPKKTEVEKEIKQDGGWGFWRWVLYIFTFEWIWGHFV